jgi:biopolymer transport protein ExbD
MVDFLFLVIAIFSVLAVTRTSIFDNSIELAKVASESSTQNTSTATYPIHISITEKGEYRWITEFNEYAMHNPSAILSELSAQKNLGLLPKEDNNVNIFLHIDKDAKWDPIVELIYALKKTSYSVHPVYESK